MSDACLQLLFFLFLWCAQDMRAREAAFEACLCFLPCEKEKAWSIHYSPSTSISISDPHTT